MQRAASALAFALVPAALGALATALPSRSLPAPLWPSIQGEVPQNPAPGPSQPALGVAEQTAKVRKPLRYVRLREGGASVRNVADVQGMSIGEVAGGALLAVYSERAGWLEVEAPGGFAVWVFGRFLRTTDREDVYEVTQNNVNMRPSPSTDVNYFPLARQLQAGDRVTRIELADPTGELAKTWVRIWSPPGAAGWVQLARTEPLAEGQDGAALWAEAERAVVERAKSSGGSRRPVEAAAPRPGAAEDALAAAQARLAEERAKPMADYDAVRAGFQRVLALEPAPALRSQVEAGLELVTALEAEAASRAQLAAEQQRRQQELTQQQSDTWREQNARSQDGRFAAVGFLERVEGPGGEALFRLVRGDEAVATVRVPTQRYELALFVGYEVGVDGRAAKGEDGSALWDVNRLEILGRPR